MESMKHPENEKRSKAFDWATKRSEMPRGAQKPAHSLAGGAKRQIGMGRKAQKGLVIHRGFAKPQTARGRAFHTYAMNRF